MRGYLGMALALALTACGSFDPEDQLALEPDASAYRAGDTYQVVVRNTIRGGTVSLGICPSLFRQLDGGGEDRVAPELPCPAVLHTLAPGEVMLMTGRIPEDAVGKFRVGVEFWRDSRQEIRFDARSDIIQVQ